MQYEINKFTRISSILVSDSECIIAAPKQHFAKILSGKKSEESLWYLLFKNCFTAFKNFTIVYKKAFSQYLES